VSDGKALPPPRNLQYCWFERKFTVEDELRATSPVPAAPIAAEGLESSISQIGMVLPHRCLRESSRSKLTPRPDIDQRRSSAVRTWTECDCPRAGLPLRAIRQWLPRLAATISNCWDEQRFGEQISAMPECAVQPSITAKLMEMHTRPVTASGSADVVYFLGLLGRSERAGPDSVSCVQYRMSTSSERTWPWTNKLQGED